MKESKNLKASKSNILVGVYLDKIKHEGQINEMFFGLAGQTHPVDVVVLDAGLNDKELESLTKAAKKAEIRVMKQDEEGNPSEEVLKAENSVNLSIVKSQKSNFSKIFNDIFNLALEAGYEGMSIMEEGDSVGAKWYSIANTFMQENEEVGFFLPMIKNWQNGALSGLMNEACWAEGMSEEAGKFDMNLLLRYNCANPLGALYRISELEEYSEQDDNDRYTPMKESVRISHYYEFFLRMVYNDVKMMTVPRVGYDFRVTNVEEFSHSSSKIPANITLLPEDKGGVKPEEVSFWMDLAKKEYFFDEDRKKVYEQQPEK